MASLLFYLHSSLEKLKRKYEIILVNQKLKNEIKKKNEKE